ncbi:MAG: hypothetical protein HQK98_10355 [Nitrospirae bacterium]|nr:hypothetical protein [Nitrospirota bacterium]
MNRRTLNILQGIGSVLEICQDVDYSKYVPKIKSADTIDYGSIQTDAENIRSYWEKAGDYLRYAMSIVDDEKDKEAKTK